MDCPKLQSTAVILDGPKLRSTTIILDGPKLRSTTVILDGQKLRSTTVVLDGPKICSTTVVLDGPKLRLTGGPSDHRPNGRSKITSHRWSIGPLSIWTVKFRKFGRSKLRHLDQGAFLEINTSVK